MHSDDQRFTLPDYNCAPADYHSDTADSSWRLSDIVDWQTLGRPARAQGADHHVQATSSGLSTPACHTLSSSAIGIQLHPPRVMVDKILE